MNDDQITITFNKEDVDTLLKLPGKFDDSGIIDHIIEQLSYCDSELGQYVYDKYNN
jgi:uncharacterized protein YjgD (DUF1641 family)